MKSLKSTDLQEIPELAQREADRLLAAYELRLKELHDESERLKLASVRKDVNVLAGAGNGTI